MTITTIIDDLANDYTNVQSELLSVQLTRAEHLAVIGALNQVTGMATGDGLAALESLVRAFEENVEDWAALRALKTTRGHR